MRERPSGLLWSSSRHQARSEFRGSKGATLFPVKRPERKSQAESSSGVATSVSASRARMSSSSDRLGRRVTPSWRKSERRRRRDSSKSWSLSG
jgi:hypothetical protein